MTRRNPRFAPEWLERKLSPSAVVAPPALVARLDDPEPPIDPAHPGFPHPSSPPTNPPAPH